MALSPKGRILFLRTPFLASKTFPCQAKWLMNLAMVGLNVVPGATMAVPSASPSGILPTGLFVKRASSSDCDMLKSLPTSYAIVDPPAFVFLDQIVLYTTQRVEKKLGTVNVT